MPITVHALTHMNVRKFDFDACVCVFVSMSNGVISISMGNQEKPPAPTRVLR